MKVVAEYFSSGVSSRFSTRFRIFISLSLIGVCAFTCFDKLIKSHQHSMPPVMLCVNGKYFWNEVYFNFQCFFALASSAQTNCNSSNGSHDEDQVGIFAARKCCPSFSQPHAFDNLGKYKRTVYAWATYLSMRNEAASNIKLLYL